MRKIFFLILLPACFQGQSRFTQDFSKDISMKALQKLDPSSLTVISSTDEISIRQEQINSAKFYYYDSSIRKNYSSYVYFYFNEAKQNAFYLVNYDNKHKLIDLQVVSSIEGDGGFFDYSNGKFLDDSTVLREDISGRYLLDSDSLAFIDNYYKVKIKILKSGLLRSDTISQQHRYTESMLKLF